MELKILHLPMLSKWYLMVESLTKTEEYRAITPHWCKRLLICKDSTKKFDWDSYFKSHNINEVVEKIQEGLKSGDFTLKFYDTVKFSYGYTRRVMYFNLKSIHIGEGKEAWGAEPNVKYFVLSLGEKVC